MLLALAVERRDSGVARRVSDAARAIRDRATTVHTNLALIIRSRVAEVVSAGGGVALMQGGGDAKGLLVSIDGLLAVHPLTLRAIPRTSLNAH